MPTCVSSGGCSGRDASAADPALLDHSAFSDPNNEGWNIMTVPPSNPTTNVSGGANFTQTSFGNMFIGSGTIVAVAPSTIYMRSNDIFSDADILEMIVGDIYWEQYQIISSRGTSDTIDVTEAQLSNMIMSASLFNPSLTSFSANGCFLGFCYGTSGFSMSNSILSANVSVTMGPTASQPAAWSIGIPAGGIGPVGGSVGFTSNGDSQFSLGFSFPNGVGRPDIGVTPSSF